MSTTILPVADQHGQQSTTSPGELLQQHQEIQDYVAFCRAITIHATRSKTYFTRAEQLGLYLTLLDARSESIRDANGGEEE